MLLTFRDKKIDSGKLYNKAKGLALDTIAVKCQRSIDAADLFVEERNYIRCLLDQSYRGQIYGQTRCDTSSKQIHNSSWKIRMRDKDFSDWVRRCNTHLLYFDGTSKSNPGKAGAGGIICNANGDTILSFEWGLGPLSNNKAEALALYQGLLQLQVLGIHTTTVIGDSAIIISLMVHKRTATNLALQQLIIRCHALIQQMNEIQFIHVLRSLNKEADAHANNACHKSLGSLQCNAYETFCYLP